MDYFLCICLLFLYKRDDCCQFVLYAPGKTVVMEFREDTNDSWVFAVDETQFAEKDDDVMIWDKYHTEGSTDSWIWEVDESQYGGGNGSTDTENDGDNTTTESGTEMLGETQDSDGAEEISEPDGAEEVSEPEYSDGSVTEGERFYTINEVRQVVPYEKVPYNGYGLLSQFQRFRGPGCCSPEFERAHNL